MRSFSSILGPLILVMAVLLSSPARALPVPIENCFAFVDPNCVSSSTALVHLPTTVTTVTQFDFVFSTELVTRMLGGPILSDQTLSVAFGDPAFLALIESNRNLLTLAGAASFQGPTLVSDTTSHVVTSNTVVTTNIHQVTTTHIFFGPDPALVGDLGTCQAVAIDRSNPRLSGCDGRFNVFALIAGQDDTDTLEITVLQSLVTTIFQDHTFIRQVYDLIGVPEVVASVPEPSSLLLFAITLVGFGFFGLKRARTRC